METPSEERSERSKFITATGLRLALIGFGGWGVLSACWLHGFTFDHFARDVFGVLGGFFASVVVGAVLMLPGGDFDYSLFGDDAVPFGAGLIPLLLPLMGTIGVVFADHESAHHDRRHAFCWTCGALVASMVLTYGIRRVPFPQEWLPLWVRDVEWVPLVLVTACAAVGIFARG